MAPPSSAGSDPAAILEELRADVGQPTPWRTLDVTAADVERFRSAVDPDARGAGPPSAVAEPPLMFFCPDPIILAQRLGWRRHRPYPNTLDGGTHWTWFEPIRAGDTVKMRAEVVGVEEKMGSPRTGRMYLTELLITCATPSGEVLAHCRGTSISYEGPGR
jgi:hypothetical protein